MTEEQIKQFPTSAEEYFYKQVKEGLPWKAEVYQFFEVINFYRKTTKELQEENERLAKHILELQKDKGNLTDVNKLLVKLCDEAKEIIREYIRLSLQEDKDIDANVKLFQKAQAFVKVTE